MEPTVPSEQVTWYNSYQAYYPGYSLHWRPWMLSGTYVLPEQEPSYYYQTKEEQQGHFHPSKRMRGLQEDHIAASYSYNNTAPQDQQTIVFAEPGLLSNQGDLQLVTSDKENFMLTSGDTCTVVDPKLISSDNVNCNPTSYNIFSVVDSKPINPDKEKCNSTSGDTFSLIDPKLITDIENGSPTSGDMFSQQPTILVVQPDGSKTSLWDWQCSQQQLDDQPINPVVPSFKSISIFAGTDIPTGRRGRHGKNSTCNLCNKTFESSYKLKLHMFAHTGEKPFVCDICNKGFTRGPNLNQHHCVHSAGAYPCPHCGKAFRNAADRLVHVLTQACTRGHRHLRQTVHGWQCLTCNDKVFTNKDQAERHTRQHELGKGMICPVCNQNFHGEKPNVLVRHVKKQHREYIPRLGL